MIESSLILSSRESLCSDFCFSILSILGAYTGILQGLSGDKMESAFIPYVNNVFGLVEIVSNDENCNDTVLSSALGAS